MNTCLVGLIGELKTFKRLTSSDTNMHLNYLVNFPLKGRDTYMQADAVIVCTRGVFCLEVKNWEGTVQCSNKFYWRVKYPSQEIVVRSPLMQNKGHCQIISNLIQDEVFNIVLFCGGSMLIDNPAAVMYSGDFLPMLKQRPEVLSEEQVDTYVEKLSAYKRSVEPDMLADFIVKRIGR